MAQGTSQSTDLKKNVIGVIPLVFLVLAAAAPLGACAANIPLIMGLGNGSAAPMDFVFIGVLLVLFSVGFTAMSSHITNAGAFYTYISMGLGKRLGGAAGYIACAAYNVLSVYTASAGAYFGADIIHTELGIEVPWYVLSVVLYIMCIGLYALFIDHDVVMPSWLEIDTLDDLKEKLIGVIGVVMGVYFLGRLIHGTDPFDLLLIGLGTAAVITALAYFVKHVISSHQK